MKIHTNTKLVLACWCALTLAACSPDPVEPVSGAARDADFTVPVLAERPEGALSVQAARSQLAPGDPAIVFGQIGSMDSPFFEGFAGFVLADTDLVFCDEMGDVDHCPTPWDACCEDPEKIKASRLTVQFLNAAGEPILADLQGRSGLDPLREVVVVGEVAGGSDSENLVINATGVFIPDAGQNRTQ